jgi:hypothetical protein
MAFAHIRMRHWQPGFYGIIFVGNWAMGVCRGGVFGNSKQNKKELISARNLDESSEV